MKYKIEKKFIEIQYTKIILKSIDNYYIINRVENIADRWCSTENWNEVGRIDRKEGGWVK